MIYSCAPSNGKNDESREGGALQGQENPATVVDLEDNLNPEITLGTKSTPERGITGDASP